MARTTYCAVRAAEIIAAPAALAWMGIWGFFELKARGTDWRECQPYTVDIYETPMMKRSLATLGVRELPGVRSLRGHRKTERNHQNVTVDISTSCASERNNW
jgi:hypothetical protein